MSEESITISPEQLQKLQSAAAELASLKATHEAEIQAAQTRAMLARGEADAVVKQTQERVSQAEARARGFAISSELSNALAGHQLASPAAAEQLRTLLSGGLVADPNGDTFHVRSADGRPVRDYVAQTLSQEHYRHFVRPGGAPAKPGQQSTQQPDPALPFADPQSVGQQIVNAAVARKAQEQASPFGLPSSTLLEDGKIVRHELPAFGLKGTGRR